MPSTFEFMLQKGIAGGFAPPTPSAIYTFRKPAGNPRILVEVSVRPDGTPDLQCAAPRSLPYDDNDNDAPSVTAAANATQATGNLIRELIKEIEEILRSIPREEPPGSEDIYKLDIGIVAQEDDFQWANCVPEGCGGGISEVQATEDDRSKFRRAVEIVMKLYELAT